MYFEQSERLLFCYCKCIPDNQVILEKEWNAGRDILARFLNKNASDIKPFVPEQNDFTLYMRAGMCADILKVYGTVYLENHLVISKNELQTLIDICETWYQKALRAGI